MKHEFFETPVKCFAHHIYCLGLGCGERIITPPSPTVAVDDGTAQFSCEVEINETDYMEWYHGYDLVYYYQNGEGHTLSSSYSVDHDGSVSTLKFSYRLADSLCGCKVKTKNAEYAKLTVVGLYYLFFFQNSTIK